MRIPGADEALEHLAHWAGRRRWKEECVRAVAAHFEPACEQAGITEDELVEALGRFDYAMVEACAFEDFCSRRHTSRRGNVIDDYLDHRGWKESIQARDYLRALRDSVMSLYEVVATKNSKCVEKSGVFGFNDAISSACSRSCDGSSLGLHADSVVGRLWN